jgi:hypothetical protein
MERLGATDAWDFVNQSYLRAGRVTAPGLTFTRASVGSYLNNNNTMTVFSSGQPRIGDKGILIEGSRQNLFLNSAVGATQSITVTAAAHTLSFFGTGTVTLSGVSTDGPLVGTGEFNRVSLTFTPTAGSLTLTVSGGIKWVNLELGSFPTSWIPSDGTAVTRAADVPTAVPTSGTDYPLSLFAEFERAVDTGAQEGIFAIDDNGVNNCAGLRVDTSDRLNFVTQNGGTPQAAVSVVGVTAPGNYKSAARIATNNTNIFLNGVSGIVDTVCVNPLPPSLVRFGLNVGGGSSFFNYLRTAAIIPRALSNSESEGITT